MGNLSMKPILGKDWKAATGNEVRSHSGDGYARSQFSASLGQQPGQWGEVIRLDREGCRSRAGGPRCGEDAHRMSQSGAPQNAGRRSKRFRPCDVRLRMLRKAAHIDVHAVCKSAACHDAETDRPGRAPKCRRPVGSSNSLLYQQNQTVVCRLSVFCHGGEISCFTAFSVIFLSTQILLS